MLPPSLSEDQKIWLGQLYRRLKNVSSAIQDDLLLNAPEMLFQFLNNNQCRKVVRGSSWLGDFAFVYKCNSNKYVMVELSSDVFRRIPVDLRKRLEEPPAQPEHLDLEKMSEELFMLHATKGSRGSIDIYYGTPIELLRKSASLFKPTELRGFYLHYIAIEYDTLMIGVYAVQPPIFPGIIVDTYLYKFNASGELEEIKKQKTASVPTITDGEIWHELYMKRNIVEKRIEDALTLIIPPEILRQIF